VVAVARSPLSCLPENDMSSELVVPAPDGLLDVRTGELVPATPENAVELLAAARDMRARVLALVKDCEAVLLQESQRQGTKTLKFGSSTATVTGGSELAWNLEILEQLRTRGLPEERYNELVVATVTYKVDARIAKQLEAANEAYAEVIRMARSEVPKPWRVSVK
jgi:hypothetical protein